MKKLLVHVFFIVIIFVIISLIPFRTNFNEIGEIYNLGYPLNYYGKFKMSGSDFLNSGFHKSNFFINLIIVVGWYFAIICFICKAKKMF